MFINNYFKAIKGSTKRYLQIDLNYKFHIITDIVDLLLVIVAFTVLGGYVDNNTDLDISGNISTSTYDLQGFLLIGVLFWALYQRSYEDTVAVLPDEASRGTIGFLITNNVSLSTLLISRNIASTIKSILMVVFIVIPVLFIIDTFFRNSESTLFSGLNLHTLPIIFTVFILMWIFMLTISVAVSSLNIISKKVTPFANLIVNALKVLSGYYFPIAALNDYLGVNNSLWLQHNIPIVTGLVFVRDLMLSDGNISYSIFWDEYIKSMIFGISISIIFSLFLYKYLEYKSQRWGSLEFY